MTHTHLGPGDHMSTGVLGLDIVMSGGWKRGAISEIWGPPSSGKTYLALQALANRHPADDKILWVSTRGPIDFNPDPRMNVSYPKSAEQAFHLMMGWSGFGGSMIVVDDAANLVRQAELDDPEYVPDEHREFKDELKNLKLAVKNSGCTVLFLSQPRDHMRAPIRGTGISEKAAERVSLKITRETQSKIATVRADVKSMGNSVHMEIIPGLGVHRQHQLVIWAQQDGYLKRTASWFELYVGHVRVKINGLEDMYAYLADNPKVMDLLERRIREDHGLDAFNVTR